MFHGGCAPKREAVQKKAPVLVGPRAEDAVCRELTGGCQARAWGTVEGGRAVQSIGRAAKSDGSAGSRGVGRI